MCFNSPFGLRMEGTWLYEFIYFSILIPMISICAAILYVKLISFIQKQENQLNLQLKHRKVNSIKKSTIILTFLNTIIWLPFGISG